MQGADGFVLFSQYENLPCVLLEAWSCGLPVIATDVGGVGEHLGGPDQDIDLGVLLQPEDEAGLSAAVESWAQRKAGGTLPDAHAISAYAQSRFTPEAVGGAILDAYRAVLA
jgi:glycosyltransferase involved in cell wall biosynthesis